MTDREVMMALYGAIEKLYFAMVGEPLTIDVATASGTVRITASEGREKHASNLAQLAKQLQLPVEQ